MEGLLEAMRGKAVWPSIRLFFAPVEVAASLALIGMVFAFAYMVLHFEGHRPVPTNPSTGAVVISPSASDTPVLPSPSPQPSPVAQPVTEPPTNPPAATNPVAGAGTLSTRTPIPTSRPSARPTPPVLPSPLGTPIPPLPSPLATPTPPTGQ
jgi:hypothetical protein